eukprot:CAMPEP_0172691344 /NCGR_PEP_ID=MMETSP1074-20121228/24481_1 /TAXON_ID=2916 /ORGANISM="Ceratium fusus, Strain PA161109" /LENGTH=52 /DNA_ID=CAMNT_0013511393 /DNA_START=115 /DNA_END=270 /DNA_ORIENTATION=+
MLALDEAAAALPVMSPPAAKLRLTGAAVNYGVCGSAGNYLVFSAESEAKSWT